MPRFSLKNLLVSFTLIAIGVFTIMWGATTPKGDFSTALLLSVVALGGVLIGVGASMPFNRPVLGAVLGPVIVFAVDMAYMFYQASLL